MRREDVLEFEARRRVFALVRDEPGLHLRELERRSGMPLSTLRHHVGFLERHRLVEGVEDRNVRRFFAVEPGPPVDRRVVGALRQRALRTVLVTLIARGGRLPYPELLAATGFPPSTLATHLRALVATGLVERVPVGRSSAYRVPRPERVLDALVRYRASILDPFVDSLLATLYPEEGDEPQR